MTSQCKYSWSKTTWDNAMGHVVPNTALGFCCDWSGSGQRRLFSRLGSLSLTTGLVSESSGFIIMYAGLVSRLILNWSIFNMILTVGDWGMFLQILLYLHWNYKWLVCVSAGTLVRIYMNWFTKLKRCVKLKVQWWKVVGWPGGGFYKRLEIASSGYSVIWCQVQINRVLLHCRCRYRYMCRYRSASTWVCSTQGLF